MHNYNPATLEESTFYRPVNFGSETYRVNLSGNNSCGPGGAMTPCRYTVRNRLGVVRLGIVYLFGE